MKVNVTKEYRRVMNEVSISEEAKQRIAKNCAKYVTLMKIKNKKFTVTAEIKEHTTDRV